MRLLGSGFFRCSGGRFPSSGAGSVSDLLTPSGRSRPLSVKDTTLSFPLPLSNTPRLPLASITLSGLRTILNRFAIRPKTLVRLTSLSEDGACAGGAAAMEFIDAFVGFVDLEALRVRPFRGTDI